jgi:hypothetical protein
MNYVSHYDSQGRYTYVTLVESYQGLSDKGLYFGKAEIGKQYHDMVANRPADLPVQPSRAHVFHYGTKTWVINTDAAWSLVRSQRDRLLTESDWRVTKAVEMGEPMPPGWAAYRQALRDVTSQPDPAAIVWPTEPA